MEPNPYQPPSEPSAPRKPVTSVSFTIGLMMIVLACMGLKQGIKRPPNSNGDIIADLPFIAGQLTVPAVLIIIGIYLMQRGRAKQKPQPSTSTP